MADPSDPRTQTPRDKRLAEALRANLGRRKARDRAERASEAEPDDQAV
ncbi:MAG: hypothetical protein ACRYG4_10180 [Janthinobacterium lividum]